MDMSHLSYFAGAGNDNQQRQYDTSKISQVKTQTTEQIIREVIEDLLNLVFESDENQTQSFIVDDELIESNYDNLRKKVFVKERVPTFVKPMSMRQNRSGSTFKSSKQWSKGSTNAVLQKSQNAVEVNG